jgi:hypothetical protein
MGMLKQSIRCTIWILSALLVIASLDAIPDPPAVNPHTVTVRIASERAESLPEYNSPLNPFAPFRTPGILVEDIEPDCPSSVIAQTRQAADPSPPALIDRSRS